MATAITSGQSRWERMGTPFIGPPFCNLAYSRLQ